MDSSLDEHTHVNAGIVAMISSDTDADNFSTFSTRLVLRSKVLSPKEKSSSI